MKFSDDFEYNCYRKKVGKIIYSRHIHIFAKIWYAIFRWSKKLFCQLQRKGEVLFRFTTLHPLPPHPLDREKGSSSLYGSVWPGPRKLRIYFTQRNTYNIQERENCNATMWMCLPTKRTIRSCIKNDSLPFCVRNERQFFMLFATTSNFAADFYAIHIVQEGKNHAIEIRFRSRKFLLHILKNSPFSLIGHFKWVSKPILFREWKCKSTLDNE